MDFCKKHLERKMKDKPKVSTKKNENSGKKWSLELDNELINLLSSNKDIMHISDVLKRSKRSIESRIIQVVNNNQHREINCDIFPSKDKIIKITEVYNTIEDNSLLRNIRKKLGKEYSYFDITFAISEYGQI